MARGVVVSSSIVQIVETYHQVTDAERRDRIRERYLHEIEPILRKITNHQRHLFHTLGIEQEDLMQYARLGALEALDRFDTRRNTSFTHYLTSYIRKFVYNKLIDELPVPRDVCKRVAQKARQLGVESLDDTERNAYYLRSPLTFAEFPIDLGDDGNPTPPWDQEIEPEEILHRLEESIGSERYESLLRKLRELQSIRQSKSEGVQLRMFPPDFHLELDALRKVRDVLLMPFTDQLIAFIENESEAVYG